MVLNAIAAKNQLTLQKDLQKQLQKHSALHMATKIRSGKADPVQFKGVFNRALFAYKNGRFASSFLRVTLLVGIEMSFFRYRDFSVFFSVSRSSLTSTLQDVEAQKSTDRRYRC